MFELFEKILCPVDFSTHSDTALKYAAALAEEYDATLIVHHSVPDLGQVASYLEGNYIQTVTETLLTSAQEKLQEYASRLVPQKVQSIQRIGTGSAPEAILQTAQKEGADLIVMGTHGYSGHDKYLIGSVTNRVLHKCSIPLLAVCNPRHHFIHEGAGHNVTIARILCAVDLESNSRRVAQMGTALARAYDAEIQFVHVSKEEEPDILSKMKEFTAIQDNWSKAQFRVEYGEAAQQIVELAEQNNIDLVIMGHHTRKPLEEYLVGSVTKRVIPDCVCPVLVVRSAEDLIPSL